MIKLEDMKDKDLVHDAKRRIKRIRKEQRLILADIEEWARRQQSITPITIQEHFGVSMIMASSYYYRLCRDAEIEFIQRAAGPDRGYQPKQPNVKKHYKPGVYAREITAHESKPVPPAGSNAPDA